MPDSDTLLPTCRNKNKPSPTNFKKDSSVTSCTRVIMRDEVLTLLSMTVSEVAAIMITETTQRVELC